MRVGALLFSGLLAGAGAAERGLDGADAEVPVGCEIKQEHDSLAKPTTVQRVRQSVIFVFAFCRPLAPYISQFRRSPNAPSDPQQLDPHAIDGYRIGPCAAAPLPPLPPPPPSCAKNIIDRAEVLYDAIQLCIYSINSILY